MLLLASVLYSTWIPGYEVQARLADGNATNNEMQLHFRIYNKSGAALDLRSCQLRYHFTETVDASQLAFDIWWFSKGGNGDVQVAFASAGGDARAFNLSFLGGWVASGDYAEIQMRVRKSDWSNFDESNDPSVPVDAQWAVNERIELTIDGVPVWGEGAQGSSSMVSSSLGASATSSNAGLSQAVIDPVAVTDMLRSVNEFAVWGTEGVWLADRTVGYLDGVELYGSVGTNTYAEMGADSRMTGGLYAGDSVFLRERAYLDGDLRVGLGYATQNATTIKGTVSTASPGPSWTLPVVNGLDARIGSNNVTVPVDGELSLEPGSYNNLQVFSRSTLHLGAGTYVFRNFRLEPDVILDLDIAAGPIVVQVLESVNFADRTRMTWVGNNVNPLAFQVYQQGTSDLNIGTDQTLAGRFLAPHAKIRVSSRVKLAGWLQGNTVQIEPDTKICEPPTLGAFTHSEVAYGPSFDKLQSQYQAVVETSVAKLNVYGKSQSADATVSIAGEKSGTEFTIPTSGRSLTLRAYSAERAAMMPWCAETRYTLAVKPQSNAVVRVKSDADCSGAACDGSSWEKAFKNLSTALAVAREQGKTVQIAEGRYALQGARSSTYLLGSGMDVRGGFVGIEGETVEGRRGDINKVVISGDVANNDGTIWLPSSRTQANTGDNAYHVVTLLGGGGLPYAQRLDRVNIQGGVADGSGVDNLGAGILAVGASPWLEYLIVQRNQAQSAGGAIYSNQSDTLHLANSYVVENKTLGRGGAVALEKSTSVWSNTVIASNVANSASVLWSKHSYLALLHATVAGNSQSEGQLAWVLVDSKSDATNSIVRGNATEASDALQVSLTRSNIIWDHCAIQGAWLGKDWNYDVGDDAGGNIGDAPAFLNAGNAAGVDGAFYGADDGLQLTEKSFGIDQGVVLAQSRVQEDVFATTRPVGEAADIGAYEYYAIGEGTVQLGRMLQNGEFVASESMFVLDETIPGQLGKFPGYVVQLRVKPNKHIGSSFYANVNVQIGGVAIGKTFKLNFYKDEDGADKDGNWTYYSRIKKDHTWNGVELLFMTDPSRDAMAYGKRQLLVYAQESFSLLVVVPHSQF